MLLQVIRIPGYIADEKMHIARQFLEPQAITDAGVPLGAVTITPAAMADLIGEYCRYYIPHTGYHYADFLKLDDLHLL